jgi:hypothetical protein
VLLGEQTVSKAVAECSNHSWPAQVKLEGLGIGKPFCLENRRSPQATSEFDSLAFLEVENESVREPALLARQREPSGLRFDYAFFLRGPVSERLGDGLQNRLREFKSHRGLNTRSRCFCGCTRPCQG